MASTLLPISALNYAKEFIQHLPLDRAAISYRILDDAAKIMWVASTWRWSVGLLPLTAIVNDTDEITIGGGGVPADFLRVVWAGLVAAERTQDLTPVAIIPDAGEFKGQIRNITSTTTSSNVFRFYPIPTGYNPLPKLAVVYKKKHTEITSLNAGTAGTLVFDDEWFPVYQAFVLYYAFLYAEDPRATGQFTTAMGLLDLMKTIEPPVLNLFGEPAKG